MFGTKDEAGKPVSLVIQPEDIYPAIVAQLGINQNMKHNIDQIETRSAILNLTRYQIQAHQTRQGAVFSEGALVIYPTSFSKHSTL